MHNPQYPIKKWYPVELKNKIFWLDYVWNIYNGFLGASIFFTFDSVIFGFMIHGITQLDVLKLRIKALPSSIIKSKPHKQGIWETEQEGLNKIIEHHQSILR